MNFEDLFVLELSNNHRGDVNRGLEIIERFSRVVRDNGVRASIKLQFRDVDTFVHQDFRNRTDIRYIRRTLETRLDKSEYSRLVDAIRDSGCIVSATPFDEPSVDLCEQLGIEIIKIASADINDGPLIEKISETRKPVIASTGGASVHDIDHIVAFFCKRGIPLGINHCVSLYPTRDDELELNQIDYLRGRYNNVIGLSTHECHDWHSSVMIAYAKGARMFERHIDLDGTCSYSSQPVQIDSWFKAWKKAKEMCGTGKRSIKRSIPEKERAYLDTLIRGVYASKDLPAGHVLSDGDWYLAIPWQEGQLSCRDQIAGNALVRPCLKHQPLTRFEVADA